MRHTNPETTPDADLAKNQLTAHMDLATRALCHKPGFRSIAVGYLMAT